MRKKIILIALTVLLLAAVLFVPIPGETYKDGGTRAYTALTYKVVKWNRLTEGDTYEATKVYWFPDNFKSIDELWEQEAPETVNKPFKSLLFPVGISFGGFKGMSTLFTLSAVEVITSRITGRRALIDLHNNIGQFSLQKTVMGNKNESSLKRSEKTA